MYFLTWERCSIMSKTDVVLGCNIFALILVFLFRLFLIWMWSIRLSTLFEWFVSVSAPWWIRIIIVVSVVVRILFCIQCLSNYLNINYNYEFVYIVFIFVLFWKIMCICGARKMCSNLWYFYQCYYCICFFYFLYLFEYMLWYNKHHFHIKEYDT